MLSFYYVAVFTILAVSHAQDYDYQPAPRPAPARINPSYSGNAPKPTPVAILKQINRHNEDGSYTYGYEGADGSFKIETKLPTGEVKGKYGYVDDTGKVRVVEYGATKYGFQPAGEGITVAPPTLVDETTNKDGALLPEYSGAYYDQDQAAPAPIPVRPAPRPRPQPQPQRSYESYSPPQQFDAAPPRRTSSPVPQRPLAIPGAVPASTQSFDFGPPSRPSQQSYSPISNFAPAPRPAARPAPRPAPRPSFGFSDPAPIEEDFGEPESSPIRSAPRITYAQPAPARSAPPQYAPAPRPQQQYAPRPSPSGGRSGGILDQLSRDYALPENGAAPLHDISFGYY